MYTELLTQAGLSEKEAAIYEKLLELGSTTVGKLLKHLPYKRGDLYNILASLRDKGLASEGLAKGIMTFTVESPEKITDLLKAEDEKRDRIRKSVTSTLPDLKSLYNLSMNKPGVRFFEGEEGAWKVLEDTLATKGEIYSYADIDAIIKHDSAMNRRYGQLRQTRGIKKKGIVNDTLVAREFLKGYLKEITETKLITLSTPSFGTVMNIYDNKISFLTLSDKGRIGIIIEDEIIAQMQKSLFEYLWQTIPGPLL